MKSVTDHFAADHDRLDGLLSEYQALKRTDHPAAKEKFKEFLKGLTRHIVWEEEVLFPIFEKRTGMKHYGPTEVMRMEHVQIKGHLDAIHEKVRAADPDSDEAIQGLLGVLEGHNRKEEQILYPSIDEGLDPAGLKAAQKAMDDIPPERYSHCCGNHA